MTTKIISSKFIISSPSYAKCPPADIPEYAFIGRSNVGKSSLINAICDKRELAKTSAKPGKTQLINYFELQSIQEADAVVQETKAESNKDIQTRFLVDLPGYGYAKVTRDQRQGWVAMIEDYILQRSNLERVFVLIDSRHSPQKLDLEFVNRLYKSDIQFSLILTKADKVSQKEVSANLKLFMNELSKTIEVLPEYFVTSAEKRSSTNAVVQRIHELNRAISE